MLSLAHELQERGHRATFLNQVDAARFVDSRSAGFQGVGLVSHPPGHLAGVLDRMASVSGVLGLGAILRDMSERTRMFADELPGACRALGVDAIVADQTEAAAGLAARRLGLPFVSVANALPLNREPELPPPFTGWRYDPSGWGRERNRGGYRVSDWLMRRHGGVIAHYAEQWSLGPIRSIEDCASPLAQISQTVAGFDFPRRAAPETFHPVGPLRPPAPEGEPVTLPPRDGRPVMFASLGTLQGRRIGLFRRIAEAAERVGVQLIVAHGGGLSSRQAASLAGNPIVYDFVPQRQVLRQTDVAVLHGGLNTVLDALAAAVPIVAVPIAFEQAAIAARLAHAGAGVKVRRRWLTAGGLARQVGHVLRTPSFRVAAGRLADEIAASGGVSRAADIVEEVFRTGRPVRRREAVPMGSGGDCQGARPCRQEGLR
ncbi:MAG: Zeaxanthin glucosyltransferase [Enterovirga sp.]|nr:Zeaxanthin glucosyltransferase [Enterovirga sp.]